MYQDLRTLFHRSPQEAERVYQARLNDSTTTILPPSRETPIFFLMVNDIYKRILEAERLDRKITETASAMPKSAIDHYIATCMIDEIILTNDIEGVVSTYKEVEAALDALRQNDKRMRFQGIANKYNSLSLGETIPLETCEDIRNLYDDLVLDEVVKADPAKAPDGKLFRTETVRIVDEAQRIIHESNLSEDQIGRELTRALSFFNDDEVEPLVRAAAFHFVFAFIHPFYDGNGRMSRFMSSYLITQKFSRYAGVRLSFAVKENIQKYYKAFAVAEHPLNKGDITPFIIAFLDIVVDALQKTHDALVDKQLTMELLSDKMCGQFNLAADSDMHRFGMALVEGSLFTNKGVTVDNLKNSLGISEPTVYKRLAFFKDAGLLARQRSGKRNYYSLDTAL